MKKNTMNEVNLVAYGDVDVLHSVEYGTNTLFVEVDGKLVELDVQMFQVTESMELDQ